MTPQEQHLSNDLNGLHWVHKFGWLRTNELGSLLWPNTDTSRHQAERLVRSWLKRELVLARKLPQGVGRALVLAQKGVRLLSEHGIAAKTGKDIGETYNGVWIPPSSWRHDLLASGVLVDLYKHGWSVYPEAQIRRHVQALAKWPDGLAKRDGHVLWVEVESTRKTGPALRLLAESLCSVAQNAGPLLLGLKPTGVLVGYRGDAKDERGYALDHRARVSKALSVAARVPVPVLWARCALSGVAGVCDVAYEQETIRSDAAAKIRRVLDAGGWRDEEGCLVANYGARLVYVWEDSDAPGFWGWNAGDKVNRETSIDAAKRACAAALAEKP